MMSIKKKIIAIIGARPQFIKHAPIEIEFYRKKDELELITIHTGQHYDENMSAIFFSQLKMATPKYQLEIGSHSHGKQTGRMMEAIENIILKEKADGILVYGDTNSTLAGALVGSKLHLPIFHVEAGLRSYNKTMPEEINRVLTDHVSSILFVPTKTAVQNLNKEGIYEGIVETGDVMYDMVLIAENLGVLKISQVKNKYYLATIHRPYNTDDPDRLFDLLRILNSLDTKVKCPFHPRTISLANKFNIALKSFENIEILPPASYFDNLNLMYNAEAVITDSGGMQKEAYFLRKKCVTLRPETEWIETLTNNWNQLVFKDLSVLKEALSKETGMYVENVYGKGDSRKEIIQHIVDYFANTKL